MKNIVFLVVFFFVSLIAVAQKSYYSVGINLNYYKPIVNRVNGFNYRNQKTYINGVEAEKYFKFGLKISTGVNFGYNSYDYTYAFVDSNFNVIGNYSEKGVSNSILFPFTIGYNFVGGNSPFQLFIYGGCSFNTQFYTKWSTYNNSTNGPEMTYERKQNWYYRYVSVGIDARYLIKNKFYAGLSFAINDRNFGNRYYILRQPYYSVGLKAGFLF